MSLFDNDTPNMENPDGHVGVSDGGTGASMALTGGADHAVMQLTVGGPFTTRVLPWTYVAASGVDQTAVIQAAIDISGPHRVLLGPGQFIVSNTLTIAQDRVHIVGQGVWATSIRFAPTSGGLPLFHFTNGASVNYHGSLREFAITSTETVLQKIAIRATDCSRLLLQNLVIGPTGSWIGNSNSIGIQLRGREYPHIFDVDISTDNAYSIEANPNSTITLDHALIVGGEISNSVGSAYPLYNVLTGCNLTSNRISNQAWIRGTHGFYFNDTTTAQYSDQLTLSGIRWEQATGGTGYVVYFSIQHGFRNLHLIDIQCGGSTTVKGFYLRNVERVLMENCGYLGTLEALNIDGTVEELHLINCLFNAGSTISTTGITRIFAAAHGNAGTEPIHATEIWVASANGQIASGIVVSDDSFNIADSADQTKRLQFETSGITTATTRTLTVPNYDGTIVTLAGTETLSGKTLSGNVTLVGGSTYTVDDSVANIIDIYNQNVTGAVSLRLYNGRTDASNYAIFNAGWFGSDFQLGATKAGTGTQVALSLTTGGVVGLQLGATNPHVSFPVSHKRVTTQFDKTDTTLANITGITFNVTAGKKYRFRATLYTTSDVGGGVKAAIAGTATATSIIYESVVYSAGVPVAVGAARATALATAVGNVTAVTAARIEIVGTIVVNAAGTLTCQFAENAAVATSSVLVNSDMQIWEIAA